MIFYFNTIKIVVIVFVFVICFCYYYCCVLSENQKPNKLILMDSVWHTDVWKRSIAGKFLRKEKSFLLNSRKEFLVMKCETY